MKKTFILKVDSENPDPAKIQAAAEIIQKGGLVAFPTETVYGLGADALNGDAVLGFLRLKSVRWIIRQFVHISHVSEVYPLATEMPKKAEVLMKQFWPGPLTLVFKRTRNSPQSYRGRLRHRRHSHAQTHRRTRIN